MAGTRLKYVERNTVKGTLYLSYRRGGVRVSLPCPEGSPAFLEAYEHAHNAYGRGAPPTPHTVAAIVEEYLSSADFQRLSNTNRLNYRPYLERLRDRAGSLPAAAIDILWVERLRDMYADKAHTWNDFKARAQVAWSLYARRFPEADLKNPWREARRLKVGASQRTAAWPDAVLIGTLHAATPEFRALLMTLLLTSQRIGDVCRFSPEQYDEQARTLRFQQGKSKKFMILHIPAFLASIFEASRGRVPGRLLCTPRGVAWTPDNAQEHLQRLREQLALPDCVLHGLRATGPTALAMRGAATRSIRSITGHTDDATLEHYLRGVVEYQLAKPEQEKLAKTYEAILTAAQDTGNARRFSGVTGRAATKAKLAETAKLLPNAKPA